MSTLSRYIGDTDIIVRFRVRQLRVAVLVIIKVDGGGPHNPLHGYVPKSHQILSYFSLPVRQ